MRHLVAAALADLSFLKRKAFHHLWEYGYRTTIGLFHPLSMVLAVALRQRVARRSVLHVSYPGHVPFDAVEILRAHGIEARYLALGDNPHWNRSDYHLRRILLPMVSAIRDWLFFWRVMSRFEVVHCHFMKTLSPFHWELPILKRMGRRIVVHFRGCEGRDRKINMARHPEMNICQDCDYDPYLCATPENRRGRAMARAHADVILVSTPDLKDFWPEGAHLPFFVPSDLPAPVPPPAWSRERSKPFKIVHATNHPGIEGTHRIMRAVAALVRDGWRIDFVNLKGVSHEKVLTEFADADLTIGKMKMGYYANAQIESMALGVPTITCVRPNLMTDGLRDSAFVFSSLDGLGDTIRDLLLHPGKLAATREKARQSIFALHDTEETVRRLIRHYGWGERPEWQDFLGRGAGG